MCVDIVVVCSYSGWPRWWSSWPSGLGGLDEGGLTPAVCVPATQLDPARLASAQDNLGNLPRDLPWDASAPALLPGDLFNHWALGDGRVCIILQCCWPIMLLQNYMLSVLKKYYNTGDGWEGEGIFLE